MDISIVIITAIAFIVSWAMVVGFVAGGNALITEEIYPSPLPMLFTAIIYPVVFAVGAFIYALNTGVGEVALITVGIIALYALGYSIFLLSASIPKVRKTIKAHI